VSLSIQNRQRRVPVETLRLRQLAARALDALGLADRDVHVAVVNDRAIRRVNEQFLGSCHSTDVLAFDLEGPGPAPRLGEVIISADTAARHAKGLGVPVAAEMDLLLVHGLLHLAGYDDHRPRRARIMHARAREILSAGRHRVPPRLWTGLLP